MLILLPLFYAIVKKLAKIPDIKIYSFESPLNQAFSIPSNILFYISKNPNSSKGLLKLQQTCKWFFGKNRILIVNFGCFGNIEGIKRRAFHDRRVFKSPFYCPKEINRINAKFWFTQYFEYYRKDLFYNELATVCSKIYQSEIIELILCDLIIKIEEFELLVPSKLLQKLILEKCDILDADEQDIGLDVLCQKIPKIKNLFFRRLTPEKPTMITNETLENMIEYINDNSITEMCISRFCIPSDLSPDLLCAFIEKCTAPKAEVEFTFRFGFLEQKTQIRAAVRRFRKEENGSRKIFFSIYF